MKLYSQRFGKHQAPAIVIVHGLAGSSLDWKRTAQALAHDYCVYTLDLRNHGKSPHTEDMTYECLTQDLLEFIEDQNIPNIHLIGHSIGGKSAMHAACTHPEHVKSLTVIDIAPKPYDPNRRTEFDAMLALEKQPIADKESARLFLAQTIQDKDMLEYLLESLVCEKHGTCHWSMNLPVLANHLTELRSNPLSPSDRFDGPTLIVQGELSSFIQASDLPAIRHHFPHAHIECIANVNHFPHRVQPITFLSVLKDFLSKQKP
jgi:pimeloyl-ACP methyl ester carboxylesterase